MDIEERPSKRLRDRSTDIHDHGENILSSPTMKLTGHKGSVYALSYSPDGSFLISASFDMTCLLWDARGTCSNINTLKGHSNAILDVKWSSDSLNIITASADKTLGLFDATTGKQIHRYKGHESIVNALNVPLTKTDLFVSVSDDTYAKIWDIRLRRCVDTLKHEFPCLSIAVGHEGHKIYTAGIDPIIHEWDIRYGNKSISMVGHDDIITGLCINPKGTHILSNSMDGTLKTWNIQPFVAGNHRLCKTFLGIIHNSEQKLLHCSWNGSGTMVTGGSADHLVHIWDEFSTNELYTLPGHMGCVNAVVFHPDESIIASASSDKSIYVGEIS